MKRRAHTFFEFLKALNRARVRYLVAGGMAVNLHGVPRNTKDLDIYVDLALANLRKVFRVLEGLGLRVRIPVTADEAADPEVRHRWIHAKNMHVLQFVDPQDLLHPVDMFIEHLVPFADAWKRRRIVKTGALLVPLMSIRDLIKLKSVAGREQDLSDIANLTKYERDQED